MVSGCSNKCPVERIDPETRKTTGITYLEVLGKK